MSRMLNNKKFDEIAAKQGKNRSSKKKRGNSLSPAYGNGYSGSSTSSSSAHRNKMWNSNSGLSNVKERNKLRVLTRSKRLHPHQDDEPQQLDNISQYPNSEDDVADIEDQQRYNEQMQKNEKKRKKPPIHMLNSYNDEYHVDSDEGISKMDEMLNTSTHHLVKPKKKNNITINHLQLSTLNAGRKVFGKIKGRAQRNVIAISREDAGRSQSNNGNNSNRWLGRTDKSKAQQNKKNNNSNNTKVGGSNTRKIKKKRKNSFDGEYLPPSKEKERKGKLEDDIIVLSSDSEAKEDSDDEVDDKSSSSSRPKEAPSDSVVPLEDYKGTKRKDPPLTQPCEFNSDKVFFGKHTPKTISTNPFRVIYTNYGIRLKRHKAPDNDDGLFIYATHIQKHRLREIGLPPLLFRFGRNTKDDMFCLRIEIAEGHAGDIRKFIRRDGVGDPALYFDPYATDGFLRYIHIYSNGDWCQQAEKATTTACKMLAKDKESPLGKLLKKAAKIYQSPIVTKEVRICYDV
jgi:hypothetical protein